jgi:hypothetical protein
MSQLSPKDEAIIETVERYGQITTSQLLRLYFSEPDTSPKSRRIRACRNLTRLKNWRYLYRWDRKVGGGTGGSSAFVYLPRRSTADRYEPHTIDIAEMFVRLTEAQAAGFCTLMEPPAPEDPIPGTGAKADLYAWLKTSSSSDDWYIEIDRDKEERAQLRKKLRTYINGARYKGRFPRVLWVVTHARWDHTTAQRVNLIRGLIKELDPDWRAMFEVVDGYDEAIKRLCG